MKNLIDNKDYDGIRQALSVDQGLANEGLPYDEKNTTLAHPLHRICDGVFSGKFTDDEGVKIARIFLENGANVNGGELIEKQDSPLVAAASLHADKVAMLYLENGAAIEHAGCHGGTALHWAAWCGRDALVKKLVEAGAPVNKICIDFKSTPLFWAVHGLKNGGGTDVPAYVECVRTLLQACADKNIPNVDGHRAYDLLNDNDTELKSLLN